VAARVPRVLRGLRVAGGVGRLVLVVVVGAVGRVTARKRRAPVPVPGDMRRFEAAIARLQSVAESLLRAHADQVDLLSQRMQVVVTESELLRQALAKVEKPKRPFNA
jgi:hypothetical protein